MQSRSYITMPATDVRALAHACIDGANARRAATRDRAIAKVRADDTRERSWLARWWHGKPTTPTMTDEEIASHEARQWRKDCYCDPPWERHYCGNVETAERLLLLAKHGDPVVVSGDDLAMVTL